MTASEDRYRCASGQLRDYLDLVGALVRRHLARHGHRLLQASGRLDDLYVSIDEARRLLQGLPQPAGEDAAAAVPGIPSAAEAAQELREREQQMAARLERTLASGEPPALPIEELRAAFRLEEAEVRALVAAAAPAISVDLARLYTFAWADFAVKEPSVGFIAELLAADDLPFGTGPAVLSPRGTLLRSRLVVLRGSQAWSAPAPHLHRGLAVPESVIAVLQGAEPVWPPHLVDACDHTSAAAARPLAGLVVTPEVVAELERALRHGGEGGRRPRVLLLGEPGVGRRTLLSSFLAQQDLGLVTVDLTALAREPAQFGDALADAFREATLRRAALLLRADAWLAADEGVDGTYGALRRTLAGHEGLVAISARRPSAHLHRAVPGLVAVALPFPAAVDQRRAWRAALTAAGVDGGEALATEVVARVQLAPGAIQQAVEEAISARSGRLRPGRRGAVSTADLLAAVKHRVHHSLGDIAEPFTTTLTMADAVLPDEVRETLAEILAHARHREAVYDDWGFRRKLDYGLGLSCLFYGPPGTGKTMMAGILATELGKDVYRIDLSRVTSKWVGETEKNLSRLFDEAERAQAILLFDEADSLFAKRTEVRSSNDRFANMEVNFLLQRMEAFDGMTILTTNFESELDAAFKRRIRFRVLFPMPEAVQRNALWRSMIPACVPLAEDVAFGDLARRFALAGGSIKNAALRAAFFAAEGGGIVTQAHLLRAATAEAREMGVLVRD